MYHVKIFLPVGLVSYYVGIHKTIRFFVLTVVWWIQGQFASLDFLQTWLWEMSLPFNRPRNYDETAGYTGVSRALCQVLKFNFSFFNVSYTFLYINRSAVLFSTKRYQGTWVENWLVEKIFQGETTSLSLRYLLNQLIFDKSTFILFCRAQNNALNEVSQRIFSNQIVNFIDETLDRTLPLFHIIRFWSRYELTNILGQRRLTQFRWDKYLRLLLSGSRSVLIRNRLAFINNSSVE